MPRGSTGRSVWSFHVASVVFPAIVVGGLGSARAGEAAFEAYSAEQGLTSAGGACMVQAPGGYVMICTQHGVFSYDGRRFENLGPQQNLRQGGLTFSLLVTATGRLALNYPDEVVVSEQSTSNRHPPTALKFDKIETPRKSFSLRMHQIARWKTGIAALADGEIVYASLTGADGLRARTVRYDGTDAKLLAGARAIYSVRDQLWAGFDGDRICRADPGSVRCWSMADAGSHGPWVDFVAGPDGEVLARSPSGVATLDHSSGRWTFVPLPDQGGQYDNFASDLAFFQSPDGRLQTQADHGLAILGAGGWYEKTVEEGAPPGMISSSTTDDSGQIWYATFGSGVLRSIGFGDWGGIDGSDGLSKGTPWQTARTSDGSLWVTTDSAVDAFVRDGRNYRLRHVVAGGSYAIAVVRPGGRIWVGRGGSGLRIIDPQTLGSTNIDMSAVFAITPAGEDTVWIGTEKGLVRGRDGNGVTIEHPLPDQPVGSVMAIASDGSGGAYYLFKGELRHRRADGTDVPVQGTWPASSFDALSLALAGDGTVWVGGTGGLFRARVVGDRIVDGRSIPTEDIQSNGVTALRIDARGWLWVGTSSGVSVFDGRRWVSVTRDNGLLSNDISEDGIRADPDGSIWIVSTKGLSHLEHPEALFKEHPLTVVFSNAMVGSRSVRGSTLPYTRDPLVLQFGTTDYGSESAVVFRYRIEGVDTGWAETSTGVVRYPFAPPGRHRITVIAYDPLTHQSSQPAQLVIRMSYPWWRRWWADALWLALGSGAVYLLLQIRFRSILAKQRDLTRRIAEATAEIRAAEEELRFRAIHDGLTGLLTRSEVERRLAETLSSQAGTRGTIVVLLDVDHFKLINDRHGHLAGDAVLHSLGRVVASMLRVGEYAGRYGGEEMLLVLGNADGSALLRIQQLHRAIREIRAGEADQRSGVTCSIGLAAMRDRDSWESVIGRADRALYEAKRSGRDRIVDGMDRRDPSGPPVRPARSSA